MSLRSLSLGTKPICAGAVWSLTLAFGAVAPANAAAPAACAALQEKYPDWKGKTLVNAINPNSLSNVTPLFGEKTQ